jgi:phthalate 4,5-dioxygenase oxygenase subunit
MLTAQQNERLARVEGDAPMGKLMRENYWIPACVSSQLIADGAPLRVRLLGRDYVAFRATDGRLGFFDERCPHRGVSLALARNEKCGLRCIFHGWKIDVSGKVVDVPTHTPDPGLFAARVKVNHYPVHEGGGIVWVWLGAKAAPKFPELPFTILPEGRVWMSITKAYCNWLQGIEATIDSAHIGTLHEAYVQPAKNNNDRTNAMALKVLDPRYEVERKPYGLDTIAIRPLADGASYVRTSRYIMPFISLNPGSEAVPGVIFIVSPIDDTHHNVFYGVWSPTTEITNGRDFPAVLASANGDLPYDPHNFGRFTGDRDHNYGQNREAMKNGHFSGFTGNLLVEDMVTQASMGPIVDRTLDHLSSADVAIVRTQQLLLRALADLEEGRVPPGAGDGLDWRDMAPGNTVVRDGSPDPVIDFYNVKAAE